MRKLQMRKRAAAVALAAALACATVICAGCAQGGQGQGQNQQAQQESASADASTQSQAPAVTVTVQLSPALERPLAEAQDAYQQENPNVTFENATFKTEDEASEIPAGGAVDLVAADAKSAMDEAETAKLVDPSTRVDLASDSLVIVVASNNDKVKALSLSELAGGATTFAVADGSTSTGALTDEALASVGCFNASAAEPDAAAGGEPAQTPAAGQEQAGAPAATGQTDSAASSADTAGFEGTPVAAVVQVEQSADEVCQAVSSGAVQAGIVRASDVYRVGGVKAVGTVPSDAYTRIVYPVALGAAAPDADAAQAFLTWCATDPDAQEIWKKWGLSSAL